MFETGLNWTLVVIAFEGRLVVDMELGSKGGKGSGA